MCTTCEGTATNCTSNYCSKNFYFLNNTCSTLCPDSYYADPIARQCLKCIAGCQSCFGTGLQSCTRCQTLGNGTSYYLKMQSTICSLSCDSGEYGFNNKCYRCDRACTQCTAYSTCSGCQSVNGLASFLSGNNCLTVCPSYQYGDLSNFSCVNCADGCGSCFGGTLL